MNALLPMEDLAQVAALRQGYFSPLSDLRARFSKFAPAEIALKKNAHDFRQLLVRESSGTVALNTQVAELQARAAD